MSDVAVIAIDGPTASGKGAVADGVAQALDWHYLDSGALYRLVALYSIWQNCGPEEVARIEHLAQVLPARFEKGRIYLEDLEVTADIRAQEIGERASKIAIQSGLRDALLVRQRQFRLPPGLVADGRDMATVVFPDAGLKLFLTADLGERATRRHKQLIEKGFPAKLDDLLREISARDARDANREVAPLAPADDSIIIDSTDMPLDAVIKKVIDLAVERKLV